MPLLDHLREFKRRVVISAVAIVIGAIVGWIYYPWLIGQLMHPLIALRTGRAGDGSLITVNFPGFTDAFTTQINVSLFSGIVLTSPIWVYEIWAFIVPGLTRKEKRTAIAFLIVSVPLFLTGCYIAYLVVPKAVEVLIGFTPEGASNITQATMYLAFILKFMLAFGVAFLVPVFLVALNMAKILPGRVMLRTWRPAVVALLIFAAIMTPTPDAYTMLFLAAPMIALYFVAVGISLLMDRRRAKSDPEWLKTPDDQASAL